MAGRKYNIVAMRSGVAVGYIKAVSYSRSTFNLTTEKKEAKGYVSLDRVAQEIDWLAHVGYAYGYTFIYQ